MAFVQPVTFLARPAHLSPLVSTVHQTPVATVVKTRRRRRRRASPRPATTSIPQINTSTSNLPDDLTSHSLLTPDQEHVLLTEIRFLRNEQSIRKAFLAEHGVDVSDMAVASKLGLTSSEFVWKKRIALEARNKLVTANVRLVSVIAGQVYRLTAGFRTHRVVESTGVSRADLVQEGCLALIRAAELYDARPDTKFSTYATRAVWSACKRASTPASCIVTLPDRLRRAAHRMRAWRGGPAPDSEESFEGLEIDLTDRLKSKAREYLPPHLVQLANRHLTSGVSLDEPLRNRRDVNLDTGITRADLLQCERPLPEVVVAEELLRIDVYTACYDVLSKREADILVLRFGLDGERPMLAKDIASLYGVTGARIAQLVSTARDTLREKATYLEQLLQEL